MAWRRPGDKPLSEAMMVNLLTHICVFRPQWVNSSIKYSDKLQKTYNYFLWEGTIFSFCEMTPKCWFVGSTFEIKYIRTFAQVCTQIGHCLCHLLPGGPFQYYTIRRLIARSRIISKHRDLCEFRIIWSLWNIACVSVAMPSKRLSNFKAKRCFTLLISWLRGFPLDLTIWRLIG